MLQHADVCSRHLEWRVWRVVLQVLRAVEWPEAWSGLRDAEQAVLDECAEEVGESWLAAAAATAADIVILGGDGTVSVNGRRD